MEPRRRRAGGPYFEAVDCTSGPTASGEPALSYHEAFAECQCVIATPELVLRALQHADQRIREVALLVLDVGSDVNALAFFVDPATGAPRLA